MRIRMKLLWALGAVLAVGTCSQHGFNVFDDVLAFPQYQVSWDEAGMTGDEAVALLAGDDTSKSQSKSRNQTYEAVVLHGQRYVCSVPVVAPGNSSTTTPPTAQAQADDAASELQRARERGGALLDGMRGQCLYYLSGWWSYSFCYQDQVRQFHQLPPTRGVAVYPPQEDPTVHSYILGRFPQPPKTPASKTLDAPADKPADSQHAPRLESRGATRYMAQRLPDGTPCDLTGRPRSVDVHFHCNPASPDRIALIKETTTCAYLIIIDTPRLCHDVAFLPPQNNQAHSVACRPVLDAHHPPPHPIQHIQPTQHDLANANPLRHLTDGLEGSTPRRIVIGGIEVGAQAFVGSEGRVIEKSVIVGGGKEVFVATVATSEGHLMPKEDMKTLGIMDPTDVDKFKANVQRVAGRKAWKLDLVDTPRGREFRGIIETDEPEELDADADAAAAKGKGGSAKAKGDAGDVPAEPNTKAKGDAKLRDTKAHGAPGTRGSGSGGSSGMSTSKEQQADADDGEEDEEEAHSGTEEVYKDEL